MNPLLLIDFYKADHRSQYPKGTELVYSNFTPRKSRVAGNEHMVFFGLQYFLVKYFINGMALSFFARDRDSVMHEYKNIMDDALGEGAVSVEHIGALYDLGYLPLQVNAIPEGTPVPMQTPVLTMWNTHPEFAWLTNYFESLMSNVLWKPCTSATTAWLFRKEFDYYCGKTGGDPAFVDWQGHDFAFRGMSGVEDSQTSGAGHLLSFKGTDTLAAILMLESYYGGNPENFGIGGSVRATEHSVMSADDEIATFDRLLFETYPTGIVSIVSDTYDFWKIITEYLPSRKDRIMARDGKLVIRPDTGTPHKVLCGDREATAECEKKGLVACLYDTFGGTLTDKGFKQLDQHIGAIYGDSISLDEQYLILKRLSLHGFASTNVVLGIGSFAYQYVTRDTYGIACKATYCEVNGQGRDIFKNPKTGAWKKSHKGLLRVNEDLSVSEQVTWEQQGGVLQPVFRNGKLLRFETLEQIRTRLATYR